MSVRIKLSKASEPTETKELVFSQDLISIGREETNTLPLSEPLVSKSHARIERRDREYFIVDLKSTNSTYVNGEKLVAGREYTLHQGDEARIADYVLEFVSVDVPSPREAKPEPIRKVSPQPSAPGASEVPSQYWKSAAASDYVQQWSKLKDEIARHLAAFDVHDLAARHEHLQERCDSLLEENRRLKEQITSLANEQKAVSPSGGETGLAPDQVRMAQMMSTLLESFWKLSSGQSSFKTEFMGATVIQSVDGVPGHFQSGEDAVRFFTDPSISGEESAVRLRSLKSVTERIILHVMGLLEGYRKSVDEGARKLLQRIDPELVRKEFADSKVGIGPLQIPLRSVSLLLDLKVFQVLRRRHQDLLREDRGVLERRYFRPGFIHGYEECGASASRGQESRQVESARRRDSDRQK